MTVTRRSALIAGLGALAGVGGLYAFLSRNPSVAAIRARALSSEIDVALTAEATLVARVTNRSVTELGLHVGRETLALVKAPLVAIAAAPEAPPGFNRLAGVLSRLDLRDDQAEAVLDLGDGRTLAALMPAEAARAGALAVGAPAVAAFDPAQVILAID